MRLKGWRSIILIALLATGVSQLHAQSVTFGTLPALQVTTPKPGSTHVPNDFNGDGVSDLLWFNPTTNQLAYWLMQTNDTTGVVTRLGYQTFNIAPGYFVGATGDFNNDGLADIAFTSANHDLYFWINDGKGGFNANYLGTYPAGWQLIGAGDVDGDGYDDLLWVNPSACQFAYWLMKGTQRVGFGIVSYTCGYYPISIGYYTPSNRISIVWSSALHDVYAWDSQGGWFTSYLLSSGYGTSSTLIALGGGFGGANMSWMTTQVSNQYAGAVYGDALNRTFNAGWQQTAASIGFVFDGGYVPPLSTAGYLIEGRGTNKTGLIYQVGGTSLQICPPVGGPLPYENGPAPIDGECPAFTYPQGWYVIGAMANGIPPLVSP